MSSLLGWWCLFGFIFGAVMPKPKNKIDAAKQLFIMGPFSWIVFIPISVWVLCGGGPLGVKYRKDDDE